RLEESKKFLSAKKKEEFYTSTSKALWGYAGDKLGLPASELTMERISTSLAGRSVAPDLVARLSATIEKCEFARFAPSGDSMAMEGVYSETVDLISAIEEQIR
ncbi:MAG TPA: protein BatD, partial [Bacteroidota bacterium]|nr:protein BatD [Bacteroidota bacterium]